MIEIKWCNECDHYYSFSIDVRIFYLCNKDGRRLSPISIQDSSCPLRTEEKYNSEW